MDKYEYRVRADEIKELIAQGEFVQAAEIADTIDWRRVKSVMMLCTVSDLYKINRRYEEARDMLLLAYEQRPGGRTIVYSLCELSIKMEDVVQAVEYYKEFVQIAPKDSGRYILQYKLYEAQDVSLEERIEVLEELKKRDYREKWAYELAYLYHRVGLATKCVEECDELILWFGEGRYVVKAMELKMLHQPLTEEQQYKYDHRFDEVEESYSEEGADAGEAGEAEDQPMEGADADASEVVDQTYENDNVNSGEPEIYYSEGYVTENGYEPAPGDSYEAQPVEETSEEDVDVARTRVMDIKAIQKELGEASDLGDTRIFPGVHMDENGNWVESTESDEMDIQVKTLDMGQYNTINLQEELAAGLKELLEKEDEQSKQIAVDFLQESEWDTKPVGEAAETISEEETEMSYEQQDLQSILSYEDGQEQGEEEYEQYETDLSDAMIPAEGVTADMPTPEPLVNVELPSEMAKVLSQESDGQIRLVVPEHEKVESQITGQLSIEDILTEWERLKRENEEKRKEEVRQHVMEQTGSMFTEFEASMRDGLLERLENGETTLEEALADEQLTGETNDTGVAVDTFGSIDTFGTIGDEAEEVVEEAVEEAAEEVAGEVPEEVAAEEEFVADEEAAVEEEIAVAEEAAVEEEIAANDEAAADEEIVADEEVAVEEIADENEEIVAEVPAEDDNLTFEEEITGALARSGEETAEETEEENEAVEELEEIIEEGEEVAEVSEEVAEEATEEIAEESDEETIEELEEIIEANEAEEAPEEAEAVAEVAEEEIAEEAVEAVEEEVAEEAAEEVSETEVAEEAAEEATEEAAEAEEPIEFTEPIELEEEAAEESAETAEVEAAEEAAETSEEKSEEESEEESTEDSKKDSDKDSDKEEKDSAEESEEEDADAEESNGLRALTSDEIELYAPYIQKRSAKEQLIHSIDNISLAACTGNMIVTGTGGVDTLGLVKSVIKEIQMNDTNFSGKVAKIAGGTLNKKDVNTIVNPLKNGALIIEEAGNMNDETLESLHKCLSNEMFGIEVFLIDGAKIINKMLTRFAWMKEFFNARVDIEAMSNDSLVAFAKHYAKELEYSIDDLGILALHTRIDEMQTSDHAVTTMEVKEMVDEAIHHVNRKTLGHFMDILLAKRYDEEDMVILTEKDFM